VKYRELAKRLEELECVYLGKGKGSHRKWHNPANGKVTVAPDWGSKDLAPGTVRAIIRELGKRITGRKREDRKNDKTNSDQSRNSIHNSPEKVLIHDRLAPPALFPPPSATGEG